MCVKKQEAHLDGIGQCLDTAGTKRLWVAEVNLHVTSEAARVVRGEVCVAGVNQSLNDGLKGQSVRAGVLSDSIGLAVVDKVADRKVSGLAGGVRIRENRRARRHRRALEEVR